MSTENLDPVTDEYLVDCAQKGDRKAETSLLRRHGDMVRRIVSGFRSEGMEAEDLQQEGMLALFYAVYSYLPDRGASFRTYATVCIRNRLRSCARAADAIKNIPMKDYVPLDELDEKYVADYADPERAVISSESAAELFGFIRQSLTPLERNVLSGFLKGYSYEETAQKLGITKKAAANAMQRVRAKLKNHSHHGSDAVSDKKS